MIKTTPTRLVITCVVIVGLLMSVSGSEAASTTKTLATNITFVNTGSSTATATIEYQTTGGANWPVGSSYSSISIPGNGGQAILSQYFDTTMAAGTGSAYYSSNQPLRAMIQVLARSPQVPTQGAFVATTSPSTRFYFPLVMRSTTGSRTRLVIQNSGLVFANVKVDLIKDPNSAGTGLIVSNLHLYSGMHWMVDLVDIVLQNPNDFPDGWYGSAVVSTDTAGAKLSAISQMFVGTNGLQAMAGVAAEIVPPGSAQDPSWLIPLFASQLVNGFNTVISVQNASANVIPVYGISLSCDKDPNSPGQSSFTVYNTAALGPNQSFYFNPVTSSPAGMPTNWYGSCRIYSANQTVSFIQLRTIGTENTAAVAAVPAVGNSTVAYIPLISQRLANGFATAVTMQNKSGSSATMQFYYVSSNGMGNKTVTEIVNGFRSVTHNHAISGGPNLPDGWVGTLKVVSTLPVDGYVQLKNHINPAPAGDNLMAHEVFLAP